MSFKENFEEKFANLMETASELEEMMEEKGGVSVQNVPSFVILTKYSDESPLELPDKFEEESEEIIFGKGVHAPADILDYANFLIQSVAGSLGTQKAMNWLHELRKSIGDNEEQQ